MSPKARHQPAPDDYNETAIANLAQLVATVQDEVSELSAALEDNSSCVKDLRVTFDGLPNLDDLTRMVADLKAAIQGKDPLGGDTLGARINAMDRTMAQIEDAAKQLAARVKVIEDAEKAEKRTEKTEGRRATLQLIVSVISAITALACAWIALGRHGP